MTSLKPHEKAPDWAGQTNEERVSQCVLLLVIHGFLTEGERDKVIERARKWCRAAESSPPAEGTPT